MTGFCYLLPVCKLVAVDRFNDGWREIVVSQLRCRGRQNINLNGVIMGHLGTVSSFYKQRQIKSQQLSARLSLIIQKYWDSALCTWWLWHTTDQQVCSPEWGGSRRATVSPPTQPWGDVKGDQVSARMAPRRLNGTCNYWLFISGLKSQLGCRGGAQGQMGQLTDPPFLN